MFEMRKVFFFKKPINKPKRATGRDLSRQELLEVSQNISRYYAPKVSLSSQKLVLLAIDPTHLYAYWNLIENKPDTVSQALSNEEWMLRVYSPQQNNPTKSIKEPIAEIKISALQSGQEIKLPTPDKEKTYIAIIGKVVEKNNFYSLLESNIIQPLQGKDFPLDAESFIPENSTPFYDFLFPQTSCYKSINKSGKGKTKVL